MKVELRHLTFLCPDLDRGNVCPACPRESGSLILSMDALFGLPRKKAAGRSYQDPLHGDIFFCDQNEVDQFVSLSVPVDKKDKTCSEFMAGDALRSSQRYHALDETALFGTACRHEFPFNFINLKHGERLSYGVWLLTKILERIPSNVTLYLMYDIACMLVRHLKSVNENEYLERVKFSIPSFHAYGHNAQCQLSYSPLYCEGIGLSDGEVMERLWSYLRRFGRMTKEMHPSHRTDVLCHALTYYGSISKRKLANLLVNRWTKASEMKKFALESYINLTSSLEENVSSGLVMQWIEEEKRAITNDVAVPTISTDWKRPYFHMLHCYYTTREKLMNADLSQALSLREKVFNMESQLAEMERRYGIKIRWKPSDEDYIDAKSIQSKIKLRTSIWACVVKRHYLLRMKAKYADGQKIAKRLSKSISKETRKAVQLLDDYNETCSQIDHDHSTLLTSEVLSPDSFFWKNIPSTSQKVPLKVQKDIIEAFLHTRRSEEEMELLKLEMNSTLCYWSRRIEIIMVNLHKFNCLPDPDLYHLGAKCLLHGLLHEARLIHSKAVKAFSSVIEISEAHKTLSEETMYEMPSQDIADDDTSSSESESDYDDEDNDESKTF